VLPPPFGAPLARPPRSPPTPEPTAIRGPSALIQAGLHGDLDRETLDRLHEQLPIGITPTMRAALRPGGPIARQLLPAREELVVAPEELADPIGDAAHSPVSGVVHRYPNRALLMPTHTCAVYCRFCFRRDSVGGGALDEAALERALDYIRSTPTIREVILTGGDPLVLPDRRLGALLGALAGIPTLRHLRVHTRVPLVLPERVGPGLLAALRGRLAVTVVIHVNHPDELSADGRAALARLADGGVPLASQTVLLRGVNDDADTLEELFWSLLESRVRPYYLHQLDRARGTGHFRVPLRGGRALMRELRRRLPGLALPEYVLDIPGGYGKVPVGPDYLRETSAGWELRDLSGVAHAYPDERDPSAP